MGEKALLPLRLATVAIDESDRTALTTGKTEYSYAELYGTVAAIQCALEAESEVPEPLIGVMTGDDVGTYASILAVLASGACYVPISHSYPASRIQQILGEAGVRRVLTVLTALFGEGFVAGGECVVGIGVFAIVRHDIVRSTTAIDD